MIIKMIQAYGIPMAIACDAKCKKAWGINTRPKKMLSEDIDDYEFLADHELAEAPEDPGTYEGADAKPIQPEDRLNKWCFRECERCKSTSNKWELIELDNFDTRIKNINE